MTSNSSDLPSILDVQMVEGIHTAAVAGKHGKVAAAVVGLRDATLPGLVEYLCLRHALGRDLSLPPLPPCIGQSVLGNSLRRVVCNFGLRTTGHFNPHTGVNPLPAEFFVLRQESDFESHDYRLFETRWARASEHIGLRVTQSAMLLAMSAMTENALLHAESVPGVLVGYRMLECAVLFTVADLGVGVLESLRTNPDYRHLHHPRDALRLALQEGVSRLGPGNGFGFHQLFRALADQFGTLRFRTGNVCITMDGQDFYANLGRETYPEMMAGFQVTVCCRHEPAGRNDSPLL